MYYFVLWNNSKNFLHFQMFLETRDWIEILRFLLVLCVIVVIHLNKLFIQILKKKYKKENCCFWGKKKNSHGFGGVAWVFVTRTEQLRALNCYNQLGMRYWTVFHSVLSSNNQNNCKLCIKIAFWARFSL